MKVTGSVLAALVALAVASAAPAAGTGSRIVFSVDRVPQLYGEIYRVAPDGRRTDLSRSPAADLAPAVLPDGKQVAFVSTRGGQARVYVVGIDGRRLRTLSPPLGRVGPDDGLAPVLAWSPDNRTLAVELSVGGAPSTLYLARSSGGWRAVARNVSGLAPAWSADGRRVAYGVGGGLIAVSDVRGKRLWRVGGTGTPAWSSSGRLAVQQNSTTIGVYSSGGKLLSTFAGSSFAWSPDGRTLASMQNGLLQLRSGGLARPTFTVRMFAAQRGEAQGYAPVGWLSATTLRVLGGDDGLWHGYDTARRRPLALPSALHAYGGIRSTRGAGAYVSFDASSASLVLGTATVATAPSCGDDLPFQSLQFVGDTNALVYQSGCPLPSADVYAVAPDGSGLQQLTDTPTHEFDPALSPNGARVAFSRQEVADRCDGCPQSLWVTSPAQQLTSPQYSDEAPFDESPSWSPDGSTLVFDRSGASVQPGLFTIPAAGGPGRDLHVAGTAPAWGPELIAFERWNGSPAIQTLDPATGTVQTIADGVDASYLAWSSNGRLAYLAYNVKNGHPTIGIVGTPTSIDLSRLLPPGSFASGLAWSPDGTRFAFAASDANGVGEIYTLGVDGKGLVQVTRDLGAVFRFSDLSWR